MFKGFQLGTRNCHVLGGTKVNRGFVVVRCGQKALYRIYKGWCQECYSNRRVMPLDVFLDELKTIGVEVHEKRQRFEEGVLGLAVDVVFERVYDAFKKLYPTILFERWEYADDIPSFRKLVNES